VPPPPGEPFRLPAGENLQVQWHGGTPTLVEVLLTSTLSDSTGTSFVEIRCRYDGAAGTAVVPLSLLVLVRHGQGTRLTISALHRRFLQAGAFPIEVGARYYGFAAPVASE
jgi:hypothetical protein